jgi:hypothetical protein
MVQCLLLIPALTSDMQELSKMGVTGSLTDTVAKRLAPHWSLSHEESLRVCFWYLSVSGLASAAGACFGVLFSSASLRRALSEV